MPKAKPSIVVEITQFTGVKLTDAQIGKLERLLAEVGAVVAAEYMKPSIKSTADLEETVSKRIAVVAKALETASSADVARPELAAAASCVIGMMLAHDAADADASAAQAAFQRAA